MTGPLGQVGAQGQPGHAHDDVHGGAYLMTHTGQKIIATAVGGLGRGHGVAQRLLGLQLFGDVDAERDLGHVAIFNVHGVLRQGFGEAPDDAPPLAAEVGDVVGAFLHGIALIGADVVQAQFRVQAGLDGRPLQTQDFAALVPAGAGCGVIEQGDVALGIHPDHDDVGRLDQLFQQLSCVAGTGLRSAQGLHLLVQFGRHGVKGRQQLPGLIAVALAFGGGLPVAGGHALCHVHSHGQRTGNAATNQMGHADGGHQGQGQHPEQPQGF